MLLPLLTMVVMVGTAVWTVRLLVVWQATSMSDPEITRTNMNLAFAFITSCVGALNTALFGNLLNTPVLFAITRGWILGFFFYENGVLFLRQHWTQKQWIEWGHHWCTIVQLCLRGQGVVLFATMETAIAMLYMWWPGLKLAITEHKLAMDVHSAASGRSLSQRTRRFVEHVFPPEVARRALILMVAITLRLACLFLWGLVTVWDELAGFGWSTLPSLAMWFFLFGVNVRTTKKVVGTLWLEVLGNTGVVEPMLGLKSEWGCV